MNSIYWTAICVIIGILAGSLATLCVMHIHNAYHDIGRRVSDLEEQISLKRHPYPTADGLEESTAIANRLAREIAAHRLFEDQLVDALTGVLRQVRADPHGYKDKPGVKEPNWEKDL
jgi:hypothetical protein